MSPKLAQVLALSRSQTAVVFELDPLPELGGRYLRIAPDDTKRFNDGQKEWKRRAEVRLSEQLSAPTDSVIP